MQTRIFGTLGPVRRRQRGLLVLRGAAIGLLAGALAALALGAWRWASPASVPLAWPLAFLVAGPVAGAAIGLLRGRGWSRAAAAVDACYALKDRAVTAVDFVRRADAGTLHALQLDDAERYLAKVDPRKVVPIRVPATLPLALVAAVAALALLAWPRPDLHASPVRPLEQVVATAEDARTGLEDLREMARKSGDKDLQKLARELDLKIEEMKLPGVDVKEALAKLSEMQAALNAQQSLYNVGAVDTQMKTLGEAMASTQSLESAGRNLEQAKYEKAAQDLEQADPAFDRKEAKALKEKLQQSSQAMGEAGLGELSEATEGLLDALDDNGAARSALKKLGKLARAQGRRKQIADLLSRKALTLSECKGNCNKNSTTKGKLTKKSTKPSSNWGMSTSGNVEGEKTALDSERQRENAQGQQGEGPSETETTHSPEGRQVATRAYRELYQKYRRQTEAALNSEPIPLGHRQTIRRYFELIRPQGDDAEKTEAPAPSPAAPPQAD
jgi:tetratricopeptide (TPR) repeat protein